MSFLIITMQMKLSVVGSWQVSRNGCFYAHELCLVIYAPSVLKE